MLAEPQPSSAQSRPEMMDNPNLTFSPQINEHSRRLASASARRSSSRISEAFASVAMSTSPVINTASGALVASAQESEAGSATENMCTRDVAAASSSGADNISGSQDNVNTEEQVEAPSNGAPNGTPAPGCAVTNAALKPKLPPLHLHKEPRKFSFDSQLTFAPRINQNSLRILANSNRDQVGLVERLTTQRPIDPDKIVKPLTFRPEVSKRSMQMAEKLTSTFLSRQQAVVEKRNQLIPQGKANMIGQNRRSDKPDQAKLAAKRLPTKLGPMAIAAINLPVKLSVARKLAFSRHHNLHADNTAVNDKAAATKSQNSMTTTSIPAAAAATTTSEHKVAQQRSQKSNMSPVKPPVAGKQTMKTPMIKTSPVKALFRKNSSSSSVDSKSKVNDHDKGSVEVTEMTVTVGSLDTHLLLNLNSAAKDHAGVSAVNETTSSVAATGKMARVKTPVNATGEDATPASDQESDDGGSGYSDSACRPSSPSKAVHKKTLKKAAPALPGHMDIDRVKRVKARAAQALKQKRIFTIYGPYPMVRYALRKRGWVEFEYKIPKGILANRQRKKRKKKPPAIQTSPEKNVSTTTTGVSGGEAKSKKADQSAEAGSSESDDGDSGDDGGDSPADADQPEPCPRLLGYEPMSKTEEEEWGMLSRAVRNEHPHFIWTMMKEDIDFKMLYKDQYINHFREGHAFTTKVGICKNLRQLSWSCQQNSDEFFPRCYVLSSKDDRDEFVDNYRLTAAASILKSFCNGRNAADQTWASTSFAKRRQQERRAGRRKKRVSNESCNAGVSPSASDAAAAADGADTSSSSNSSPDSSPNVPRKCASKLDSSNSDTGLHTTASSTSVLRADLDSDGRPRAEERAVRLAVEACELFLCQQEHDDIDEEKDNKLSDAEWDYVIGQFYLICHYNALLEDVSVELEQRATQALDQMKEILPQLHSDGIRNIWIVKPGAQSRGRGIVCMDRLDKILSLVNSNTIMKESKWVVQKYIERPMLIHGTKFDIRQWFLVTDWNPLTLWFYKSSYLRFCGQQFTLLDLSAGVHLANNAIQRHLQVDNKRSPDLPDDNMWSSDQFKQYLTENSQGDKWDSIYTGMKDAIIGTLLSMQDIVECRKHSFELFGADFMLTEDYRPWLIEINCSPALSATTHVTGKLCAAVVEDTVKVVLDRRWNKKADTGDFELAFRRPSISMPSYVGAQLTVEGHHMKLQRQ
eukprot:scpid18144/ scgid5637/ Tubulin monoglycylase TTLL3; Tubulin--tyrosine ligase-like protein 3